MPSCRCVCLYMCISTCTNTQQQQQQQQATQRRVTEDLTRNSRIKNNKFTGIRAVLPNLISCRWIGQWAQSNDRSSRLLLQESKCPPNTCLWDTCLRTLPDPVRAQPDARTPERGGEMAERTGPPESKLDTRFTDTLKPA